MKGSFKVINVRVSISKEEQDFLERYVADMNAYRKRQGGGDDHPPWTVRSALQVFCNIELRSRINQEQRESA